MFTVGIRPEESGVGITRKVLHQDVLVWNTFSSWLWKRQSWEQSRISRIRHMKDTSLQWKDKGLKLGLNFDDMNNTLKVLVKRHLQPAFQYAPRLGKVESRFFFLLLHPFKMRVSIVFPRADTHSKLKSVPSKFTSIWDLWRWPCFERGHFRWNQIKMRP